MVESTLGYVITWRYGDGSGSGAVAAFADKKRAERLLDLLNTQDSMRQFKLEPVPFDGGADSVAPTREPVADAAIKAAYVAAFGSDKGWLGIEGSYFIEGYRARGVALPGVAYGTQALGYGYFNAEPVKCNSCGRTWSQHDKNGKCHAGVDTSRATEQKGGA